MNRDAEDRVDRLRALHAKEHFARPLREELRRIGYSGQLAEDALARIGAMSRNDVLALWAACGGSDG